MVEPAQAQPHNTPFSAKLVVGGALFATSLWVGGQWGNRGLCPAWNRKANSAFRRERMAFIECNPIRDEFAKARNGTIAAAKEGLDLNKAAKSCKPRRGHSTVHVDCTHAQNKAKDAFNRAMKAGERYAAATKRMDYCLAKVQRLQQERKHFESSKPSIFCQRRYHY